MSKPCGHSTQNDHYAGLAERPPDYCPVCWHYHHTHGYRELYDGMPIPPPPEPPGAPPGLWDKIKSFGAAALLHARDGFTNVSDEEYEQRLSICRACEWWKDGWCNKCGCRLAGEMAAKARWRSSYCPIKKW